MSFISLGLSPSLIRELSKQKFKNPYPIQEAVIPAVLMDKDVLGIAKTGSGKTASFVLPIIMNTRGGNTERNRHISTLVLVPTRELAIQVGEVFSNFAKASTENIKTLAVYGGVSINPQMMGMQNVNILTATPGRLLELIESNAVHLTKIETLVLDEADKMLSLGFKEEMTKIFDLLPKKRQNLLFSATLSDDVNSINQVLLNDPVVVKIKSEEENIESIEQLAYSVSEERKGPLLRHIIRDEDASQILIFVSSVRRADNVTEKLRKNGISAEAIHSKKSQGARKNALEDFKTGRLNVLIATDLLSRGIDINKLPLVINYELPRSPKDYIHRIGRTGRADEMGKAISLITPDEEHHFRVIQKKMKKWVTMIDSEGIEF